MKLKYKNIHVLEIALYDSDRIVKINSDCLLTDFTIIQFLWFKCTNSIILCNSLKKMAHVLMKSVLLLVNFRMPSLSYAKERNL